MREITGLGTRLPGGNAENLRRSRSRFHHAREDLKGGCLPRPIGSDEPENLAAPHIELNAAHRLYRAVAFGKSTY